LTATAQKEIRFSELAGWFPRQAEACQVADTHQFTLYGGYRGPGKSYWLRWYGLRSLLKLARDGIKGPRGGLFCESYPVLTDRQIGPISREFPPWLGTVRRSQEHGLGFHLHPRYGGGVLALRNLDKPEDYKSSEFAFELVDQIEQNPLETFHVLRGSLRWPGVEKPRFAATANPGGIGHLWVRDFWIERIFPPEMQALADEFAFVEARPNDNPHLSADYWQMLESLPEGLRQAWLEGNWDLFEGQMFSEWRARRVGSDGQPHPWHVIPTGPVPPHHTYYLGVDWGFSDPCAIYLVAIAHDGRVTVCRERYVRQRLTSELGEMMLALFEEAPLPEGEWPLVYAGHDVFARRLSSAGTYEEPIVQTWEMQGLPVISAGRDPLARASKFREYLRDWGPDEGWPEGRPGLQVMECCPNLIRTLPALPADKSNPEVIDTHAEDHAADALGHVLTSLPARPDRLEPTEELTIAQQRAAVVDALDQESGLAGRSPRWRIRQ